MDKRTFLKTSGLLGLGLLGAATAPWLTSCASNNGAELPPNWMWFHANMERTDEEWENILLTLKSAGITGILIGGGRPMLSRIIPMADKHGMDVHAWMWTLNRSGDEEALKHPDWYAVSRDGNSCFDVRPYVNYYQWVCPSKEEVYQHILKQVTELCGIPGLKGVHLDYVRYSDVILPEALQPVYNLVQDKEYPEFDFCYCATCREKFKKTSGIDIQTVEDPTALLEWRQYRYDSVTRLVNRLSKEVHQKNKLITAAVFPYPELARTICRQSWDEWHLDAVFPMIYQNFYNKPVEWVKYAVQKGITDTRGKVPLFAGLYLPELSGEDLKKAIDYSLEAGASGVAVFDFGSFSEAHQEAFKTALLERDTGK